MVWIRILAAAAGLGLAGAAAARTAARKAVADRKSALLTWAETEARRRLRAEGDAVARRVLRRFLISTAAKSAILATLFALAAFGVIETSLFAWAAAVALAGFLIRDVVVTWPTLRLVYAELRKHRWSARKALGEVVAAQALSSALEAAEKVEIGWKERVALAAAGVERDALAREIAQSVSDIARGAAWPELAPYARSTALKMIGGSAVYAVFAAMVFAAA